MEERFVDLTGTEKLRLVWVYELEIQKAILEQFNVPSEVGLGSDRLIAKLDLDIDAK